MAAIFFLYGIKPDGNFNVSPLLCATIIVCMRKNEQVMSQQEIVMYKNAPAFYQIKMEESNTRVAELQQYLGKEEHKPPSKIVFTQSEAIYHPSLLEDMARALHKSL